MKTEIKSYTVYDWEALPEEGKKQALERYRDINLDAWDPKEYYDSDFFHDVLNLPRFLTVETFSYSGFYCQGDGASPQLSINNLEAMIRHFATIEPSVIKALRFINSIETNGGSPSYRYSNYTKYHAPYIEIDSTKGTVLPHCHRIKEIINGLLEQEQRDIDLSLYKHLQSSYEHLQSDESIIETLLCNEYLFTVNGVID